jgi:hypothetical protein
VGELAAQEYERMLSGVEHARDERLNQRIAQAEQAGQVICEGAAVCVPQRAVRVEADGGLYNQLVSAELPRGLCDRPLRIDLLAAAHQPRRNDRHTERLQVEQIAFVQVPANDIGAVA